MQRLSFLQFILFWGVNSLSLWIVDDLFLGIAVDSIQTLLITGLLIGLGNVFVKPVLVLLTLPLTILSLGFSVLLISGFILLLISWVVPGFYVMSFWTGFFAALIMSICSFLVNVLLRAYSTTFRLM